MHHRLLPRVVALAIATTAATGPALAGVVTLSGNLGDTGNPALVASDMGPARFDIDLLDTSNNVALHALHVAHAGNVSVRSNGFVLGGIDPYFTLFSGTDPATASFRASNNDHATALGGDFTLNLALAAGDYTVAIGVFSNLSYAENLGSGVLADGFTALGGPFFFGDGAYLFDITLPDTDPGGGSVPEPGGAVLALTAILAAAWARRPHRTPSQTTNGGR